MSKVLILELLKQLGVSTISALICEYKKKDKTKSDDAIRKIIYRTKEISSLKFIRLSHNQSLIYSKEIFGSDFFWNTLIIQLKENSSPYFHVLNSFFYFNGIMHCDEFNIFSGVSNKQKKNLINDIVLNNLLESKLIVKDCDYLYLNRSYEYIENSVDEFKERITLEKLIYFYVSEWIRRIGFGSYHKIKTKLQDGDNPKVGNVEWCISAPSYITPMRRTISDKVSPGFIVADILVQSYHDDDKSKVDHDIVSYFLSKKNKLTNSNKNQQFMFFVFARYFSKDALQILRKEGVIPVTFSNMFGKSFSDELAIYSSLIKGKEKLIRDRDNIIAMRDTFNKVYGSLGQFKGFIFELFVGAFVDFDIGNGFVSYNVTKNVFFHNGEKKSAETDVMYETKNSIYLIECKNVKKLSDSEVDLWLDQRIPRFNKYYKDNGINKKIFHYLWVTGDISDCSKDRIIFESSKTKKSKIEFKSSVELFNHIRDTDKDFSKLYVDYGFKHQKKNNIDTSSFSKENLEPMIEELGYFEDMISW
ncbi:hypothetical protein [Photobacterium leiognathi]|uniref:hypothetical protein n=1 Tax=Photobacterium leiognathi TaxID=553611 RepID=UPI0029828F62|nr:hypothetical protein [Photobacterium leiognathi]